ncbi:NRDE family protein [Roseomonas sp. BN140053]|uniref:NRDE family protein n=1 Tax=Roseomonas sp. BN140053 TaxID=3391898 RepID=UPI0039E7907D
MCTVLLLRRPGHPWPLLLAANRDERLDRPWDPPGPFWPGVIAGRDRLAGGTWMALGESGVVAAVLNRPGSLGPQPGKRSRGELPLLAAAAPDAATAAWQIAALDGSGWRSFNLVLADAGAAFFLRWTGEGRITAEPLPEGVSMVTAHDPNDPSSPRVRRNLPRFRAAPPPDPDRGDWRHWESLLAADGGEDGPAAALRVAPVAGFGTVCSSLLALAADGRRSWRFAPGPAGSAPFAEILGTGPTAVG